jgi:hypothetical protein
MRSARSAALLLALACVAVGPLRCEVETATRPALPDADAPASLRGAVVIEPARLGVGDVAEVQILVVTPPGHRLRPVRPPESVPGFWLLDAETLAVEEGEGRSVHRTRIRARAREPGRFAWPAMTVEIETPEESVVRLDLEERPLEVGSVALDFPGRVETFPLRRPAEGAEPRGLLLPMAAGAALALLAVGLAAGVRRVRARRPAALAPDVLPGDPPPAWREALAGLEAARSLAEPSPERAADAASLALRRLLARRFAVAESFTTPELRELAPPLGLDRHWSALVAILAGLDELRFRPRQDDSAALASAAREATLRAGAWIGEAVPEARVR